MAHRGASLTARPFLSGPPNQAAVAQLLDALRTPLSRRLGRHCVLYSQPVVGPLARKRRAGAKELRRQTSPRRCCPSECVCIAVFDAS